MNINKIIIGIDDSRYAEHAAEYGFNLARTFKAEIGLVNIVEPLATMTPTGTDVLTGIPGEASVIGDMDMLNVQTEIAGNIIDRTIKTFGEGLTVTQFSEYGSTAEGIIKCANEFGADMIVVGTHSRSGLERLIVGSVAEHVVRYSEIPVLVVPFKAISE
jgi:nucleotide-binding universal stress UspA family protein